MLDGSRLIWMALSNLWNKEKKARRKTLCNDFLGDYYVIDFVKNCLILGGFPKEVVLALVENDKLVTR